MMPIEGINTTIMNKEWSLEKLYKGYDDPKFAQDEADLDQLIEDFKALSENLEGEPKDVLKKAIETTQKLEAKAHTLFSFASLSQAVNTSDVKAAAIQGRLSRKLSATAAPRTALVQYIAALDDLAGVIDSDPLLKEHEFYLTNIKEAAEHTLSPEVEKVISLYEISGSGAWSDLQSYLTS
jgi:oligoendopeptidase F